MRTAALIAICLVAGCYPKNFRPEGPGYTDPTDYPFDIGPYVVYARPGTLAVVIEHELSEAPVVSWRRGTPVGTATTAKTVSVRARKTDGLWVAELKDLPLDIPLSYTVESSLGTVGPILFRGGRTRGRRFRFAAFGDTRTGHKVHRSLIERMAKEDLELVIHSGDLVESGGVKDQWRRFFRIEAPVNASAPVFAALGNHDLSQRNYFKRYMLADRYSGNHRYYYRDWSDIRVILMDSEVEVRKGSRQYTFLEQTMRDGAARGLLMLVALHHPPYSAGAHGSNEEMREVLGDLCPRFGVEVVLAGHDHNYERTKRIDGVTYFVAASGGAPIRRMNPSWFSEVVRTEPHFVLFDVERGSLVGRAVNLGGETFDTFVIPPLDPTEVDKK